MKKPCFQLIHLQSMSSANPSDDVYMMDFPMGLSREVIDNLQIIPDLEDSEIWSETLDISFDDGSLSVLQCENESTDHKPRPRQR